MAKRKIIRKRKRKEGNAGMQVADDLPKIRKPPRMRRLFNNTEAIKRALTILYPDFMRNATGQSVASST